MALSALRKTVLGCVLLVGVAGCVVEETTDGKGKSVASASSDERAATRQSALKDYAMLATGYLQEGKREHALRAIKRGQEIDKNDAGLLNALALYYYSDGELKLADDTYRRAMRANPKDSATQLNYGAFLYEQKRLDEACSVLKRAVDDPLYVNRHLAFMNYGICLRERKQYAEAEQAFKRSLANNGRNHRVLLEMTELKFEQGEFPQARQYFDTYNQRVTQQSPRSAWMGVRLMYALGEYDQSESYALFLRNQFPNSAEYREYLQWSKKL